MREVAILAVSIGVAWGLLTYRRRRHVDDAAAARRAALRFALGGSVLLFAVLDWVRVTLRPWM